MKRTYGLAIIALLAFAPSFDHSAVQAEKNTVQIGKRYIRIGSINYHRTHHESACLGCLGIKRDIAHPWFEERITWDELGAEDLDVLDATVITLDADMESEWNLEVAAKKNDAEGHMEGGGGSNIDASYTLQKMELTNKGLLADMINESDHGKTTLSALHSKHHQGIHIITAVWVLVEGSEHQGMHTSIGGGLSKDSEGGSGSIDGGGSTSHNTNFEFSQDTVMAYEMSIIETKKCGGRGKNCEAVSVRTDMYHRAH